jgi:cob(I)alamin adenosyltransferase
MKIYTKTGDEGLTSLIGGTRVPKYDLRIESYGTVDELNSYIGMIRDHDIDIAQKDVLKEVQDRLFTIGAALASDPEKSKMKIPDLHLSDITFLENQTNPFDTIILDLLDVNKSDDYDWICSVLKKCVPLLKEIGRAHV